MTKTLTEQWREGTLPAGCYYVLSTEDDTPVACDIDTVCDFMIRGVVEPVPSYDEHKRLREQLNEANELLNLYLPKKRINSVCVKPINDYKTKWGVK